MLTVILTPTFKRIAKRHFSDDEMKAVLAMLSPQSVRPAQWLGRLSFEGRTILYARMSPRTIAFLACYTGTDFDDIPDEVTDDWVAQLQA